MRKFLLLDHYTSWRKHVMEKHVLSDHTNFLSGQDLFLAGQMTCLLTKIICRLAIRSISSGSRNSKKKQYTAKKNPYSNPNFQQHDRKNFKQNKIRSPISKLKTVPHMVSPRFRQTKLPKQRILTANCIVSLFLQMFLFTKLPIATKRSPKYREKRIPKTAPMSKMQSIVPRKYSFAVSYSLNLKNDSSFLSCSTAIGILL